MERIRWGILGCGNVTEVKSGPAFNKIEGSELVAVMRRNAGKAKDYALRHHVPKWYDDAEALINDPDVDAVYIATPPNAHAEYTMKVAAAGKPVYVEKPMARTYAECQQMVRVCAHGGVPLFVAYYRRCLPRFLKVKELVTSGAIGTVRFVSVRLSTPPFAEDRVEDKDALPWRVLPKIAGGGYFFDLGSHQLDFLDYLLGPITEVGGRAANQAGLYPAEDIVSGSFAFASGVLGTGIWCFTVSERDRIDRTEIVGDKGKVVYATFDPAPVRLETVDGVEEYQFEALPHVQQPLIQTVVDELRGKGTCPSTGVTAARTNWVMDRLVGRL